MNEDFMCYITYAVPKSKLAQFFSFNEAMPEALHTERTEVFPSEFVPEWYRNSSFPEDDFDD